MGRKKINKNPKGLGDVVESITDVTGIKKAVHFIAGEDCGCDKRKEQLNKVFSFKLKPNCFTEEQYNEWNEFKKVRTLRITQEQTKYICTLYASIFNKPYWYPDCFACGGTARTISDMIDRLDKVHETYKN